MEKKTLYVTPDSGEPFVLRYDKGTKEAPHTLNFKMLYETLIHDQMRGEIYDYEVRLAPGTYYLGAPFVFEKGHTARVSFVAEEGEVLLSGGREIKGFTETTVNGVKALVAEIPAVRLGEWYFEELYVNKTPRNRPVAPSGGKKYRITNVPNHPAENFGSTDVRFFDAGDGVFDGISHVTDTTVEILHFWLSERLPVTGYDRENKRVHFDRLPRRPLIDDKEPGYAKYRILNVFEELKEPGQWYLERESGRLYYIPLPGETAGNILVEAPVLRNLLEIRGEKGEVLSGITFRGITFECTGSDMCDEGAKVRYATYGQAAANRDGALRMTYANGISFEGCRVRNVGNYGIEIGEGCRNIAIEGCEIENTGAGGIRVTGAPAGRDEAAATGLVRIENCYVHDCTRVDYGAIGIYVGHAFSVRIAHNDICRLKYSGISVGWVWGMLPSRTGNCVIEYNHIHHCGDGDMSDMGGIYLLGPQCGTEVRGNYIHDIHRANYGGWGIYLDEGSTNILVEKNIAYDCDTSGFMIHYGTENIVRYNIFGHGDANVCFGAGTECVYATFYKNIFYVEENPVFSGSYNYDLEHPWVASDANFFYHKGEGPLHNLHGTNVVGDIPKTWADWNAQGHDVFSRIYEGKEPILRTPEELIPFGFPEVDASLAGRKK